MNCWHVYMIRCHDGTLYTGISTDVTRRFAEHQQAGAKAARYLKGRGPLELILKLRVGSRSRALKLEHRIKQLSREKKEALILCSNRVPSTRLQRQLVKHGCVSVFSAFGGKPKPPAMRVVVDSRSAKDTKLEKLKGYQKQYLKGLAHGSKPLVFVGQNGITPNVLKSIDESLDQHELIKVKFIDFKEKEDKKQLCGDIEKETSAELVGMIGHIAIFFRPHKNPEKRRIELPNR